MTGFFSKRNLLGPVSPKHGDLALLCCCFVTGLCDAAAFNNWGVFVGMQTGNTVILCLSSAGLPSAGLPATETYAYATTSVSLASFLLGAFLTTRISNLFGPLHRSTLTLNFLLQGLLVVLAAALTSSSLVPTDDSGAHKVTSDIRILTAIPPLAFQSGAQIATSRLLGFGELPVNVLTSLYTDLAGDPKLFSWSNVKRNRRLASVALVAAGSITAAWLMKKGPGIVGILWLAAGIKVAVAVGVGLFMRPAEREGEHDA